MCRWTFWYVYSMSHRDKKKVKQVRKNEYELREVYSFETVSDAFVADRWFRLRTSGACSIMSTGCPR